jgi:superfamily I DNA/RNA helicase
VTVETRAAIDDGTLAVLVPGTHYDAVLAAVRARLPHDVGTSAEGLDAAVAVLEVREAKGLEFDAVVLAEPAAWLAAGERGLRDLYVALTRATQRLDVVHCGDLPEALGRLVPA